MKGKAKAIEFENDEYSIHVIGRNVEVTDAMKQYAIDKVSKLEKFSNRIIDVTITMDIQKLDHKVDIDIRVNHVKIRSHVASDDMYKSVDLALDKLANQLRRYKARLVDHQSKNLAMVDMNVNVVKIYQDELAEINDEIEDENRRVLLDRFRPHEIVSKETLPLKTLHSDEAIMRLDLSGENFLIYRSEEDDKLRVIYKRNDGNFGVIEPEM